MIGYRQKSSLIFFGILLTSLTVSSPAVAQESASILGFWKQSKDSIYIHIIQEEGKIYAEMVRNDWSPGLVGKQVFQNLIKGKKNKWTGDAYIAGKDKLSSVSISIDANDELTTKVKRKKKFQWVRTEAIEKRY